MGGEFFLEVRRNNIIDQHSWSNALIEVLHSLRSRYPQIFDGDHSNEYRMGVAPYAFEFEDSRAQWAHGAHKSFRILWEWGPESIENDLGGRHRGDWSVVRFVCEFLCTKFPGQLALVVTDGFSGYNDDMGTIFFDGQSSGYKECLYDRWPFVNEPFDASLTDRAGKVPCTVLPRSDLTLRTIFDDFDVERHLFMEMIRNELQKSQSYGAATETGLGLDHLERCRRLFDRRRREAGKQSQYQDHAVAKAETAASLFEKEVAAERMAAQLIQEEEAEKNKVQNSKASKSKSARQPQRQCTPAACDRPVKFSNTPALTKKAQASQDAADTLEAGFEDGWDVQKTRRGAKPQKHGDLGARMLEEWKTQPCPMQEKHNWKLCPHFHVNGDDRRRNPFTQFFLPEQAANKVEELYHPLRFRTQLCTNRACEFHKLKVCSFAHCKDDLRAMTETEYIALCGGSAANSERLTRAARLGDFLSPQSRTPQPSGTVAPQPTFSWNMDSDRKSTRLLEPVFVPLTAFQDYVVAHSERLWQRIADMAMLYLCRVERHRLKLDEPAGLKIFGESAEAFMVAENLREMLRSPPDEIVSCDRECFSERVVKHIQDKLLLSGNRLFGMGEGVHVDADVPSSTVTIYTLRSRTKPTTGREVLGQIRFWLQQEGLDEFVQCSICCDSINQDQGVSCPNNHYICSRGEDQSCIANMISSQIANIKAQEDKLICPICRTGISDQSVASRVSASTWKAVQGAILEAKVERRYAELQSDFDTRLNGKVQELIDKYERGDVSELISRQAEAGAAKARNQALNLACPHCHAVYAEFDGCMALQCASCMASFCGYCHKATASSRGCHDHVRECDMNLSTNGSYYADAPLIKEAQRRYRIKQLKHFLRSGEYKKDVQNAIIFRLSADLKDLNIDPAALFDVGNLQGDLAAP